MKISDSVVVVADRGDVNRHDQWDVVLCGVSLGLELEEPAADRMAKNLKKGIDTLLDWTRRRG